MHLRHVPAVVNPERVAVDSGFHQPIDGVEKVVAVELGVEAEDPAAEQALQQLDAPGADGEGLRIRPWYVPESDDRGRGKPGADHRGQQREVIVLHEDHRIARPGLRHDGIGEPGIHRPVALPIALAEDRPHVGDVTQRPEAFVGEAVVVACLVLLGEPDPPQGVRRTAERDREAIAAVDRLAVRRAAAAGDPGSGARAHHRLERGDKAARRALQTDAIAIAHVNVGLAVGHGDDVVAMQLAAQHRPQGLAVPDALAAVERTILALEVANEIADVASDRLQLGHRHRDAGAHEPLAAQQAAKALHPAAPRQLRDHHRDERDDRRERDEEVQEVPPRLRSPALDRAHVAHEQELRTGDAGCVERIAAHVHQPAPGFQSLAALPFAARPGTKDRLRKTGSGDGRGVSRPAQTCGVEVLPASRRLQERLDPGGACSAPGNVAERILDRRRDRLGPQVEVARKPPEQQRIGQRNGRVRKRP